MRSQCAVFAAIVTFAASVTANAQSGLPRQHAPMASTFLDSVAGLTLEEAIAQAIEREPSLRAARSEVDVARGMRLEAGLRPNPTLSVVQQTEPTGTDRQTRIDVQWPLDLFRKPGRVNVADREIEATQYSAANRERVLAAEVRMKYGEVLTAVRELSVSDDLVAATARQHGLVSARVGAGATPPLDRDMLRVELQRLEADRLLQAGHAEHALIELKRLLGLAADAPLKLRDNLEQLTLRETALPLAADSLPTSGRPDVNEAESRVDLAEALIDQARREGRFDVSLFGMYMRTDAGFPQRAFGPQNDLERVRGVFHYWAGGITVMVPLRDRNQGEIAAAHAQRAGAAAELDATRLTARAEIAAARTRDEHARQAVAAYSSDTMALARQNLAVIGQTYELGRMTLFEVLTEQRRYLDVERAYTSALREAYEARQALRRALGEVK
jgi:cobalt-zinc-cadmium efflux system outer membrane protein